MRSVVEGEAGEAGEEGRSSAAGRAPAQVAVFERRERVPPRVWALWLGSLAFVGIVTFAMLLAR